MPWYIVGIAELKPESFWQLRAPQRSVQLALRARGDDHRWRSFARRRSERTCWRLYESEFKSEVLNYLEIVFGGEDPS